MFEAVPRKRHTHTHTLNSISWDYPTTADDVTVKKSGQRKQKFLAEVVSRRRDR